MSELRGIKLNHVVFDEAADMTPEQEKKLEKIMRLATMYGTMTGRISCRTCSHCKQVHETHPFVQDRYDHPFFNNNLEYLEWRYAKTL
jgi:hypothetical protein